MTDPIGYTDFFITNPEGLPLSYQPIYFFSLGTTTSLIIGNTQLAIDMFNLLSLLGIIFLIFKLLLLISKNKTLAFVGICFFAFSCMQYWLISHRLIDPILNFLILLFIYLFIKYKGRKEILLILFSIVIINLKITGILFLMVIRSLYLFLYFIKRKDKIKFLYFALFGTVLLIPFIIFYQNQILNIDSNAVKIVQDYGIKDAARLDRLGNYLLNYQLGGIVQFFSVFKTNNSNQKDHDFGVINIYVLFLLAMILYLTKKESTERYPYHILLIGFFLLALVLNQLVAIARYSYFINIIFYLAFFIGSRELFKYK
ncbi:MAG: hypothetical protein NTX91_05420, partial [candidate division SR1 bacterium]|nr:hypothetical protein [candidate division SR1 bacterium]